MVPTPEVSVLIPTLNAGPGFEWVLEKLAAQRIDCDYEVIVVDSGSTDSTVSVAQRYGVTVHQIPRAEFNHGGTRNLGAALSRGKYVALLVQDALPLDERWLWAMVENLERDQRVAGVYSRQVPRPECSVLTRVQVNSWATANLERREQSVDTLERYRRMSPMNRRLLVAFDNVSSCLRRSVWEELPFEKTDFGEDLRWGKKAIEAGYKLVYEPRSAVLHSHERGGRYDLQRHYANQLILSELFGLTLVPSLTRLLSGIPGSSRRLYRMVRQEGNAPATAPQLMLLAFKSAFPVQVGAYLGAKSGSLAKVSPYAFEKLNRFLSKDISGGYLLDARHVSCRVLLSGRLRSLFRPLGSLLRASRSFFGKRRRMASSVVSSLAFFFAI